MTPIVPTLPARLKLQVIPTLSDASNAGQMLADFIAQFYSEPRLRTALELAAAELLTNIVRHGAPRSPILLRVLCLPVAVSICVADDARPYDMSSQGAAEAPDVYAEHGRGLWLIRQSMDGFRYRQCQGRNVHRITRRVCPGAARAN